MIQSGAIPRGLTALFAAAAIGLLLEVRWISDRGGFILMSVLFVLTIGAEIWSYVRREGGSLASPAVLASIWGFLLAYGIGNGVYLLPESGLNVLQVGNPGFGWMTWMVALALIGQIAMWAGFRSQAAANTGERFWQSRLIQRNARRRFETVRWEAVLFIALIAFAARVAGFSLGIFGYSSDADLLVETESFRQYLTMAQALGSLSLATAALVRFSSTASGMRWVFPVLLVNELAWGFLSGFKSGVVLPFVLVGVVAVVAGHPLPRRYIVIALLAIVVAYNVIEPFRVLRFEDPNFDIRSPLYVANTLIDVATTGAGAPDDRLTLKETLLQTTSRMSVTGMGAQVLEYEETVGVGADAPPFLANLYLSPVYAFVPRFLWPNKPTSNLGAWMYRTVLGNAEGTTGVGIGPVSYLYLAGGVVGVIGGFFLLGFVQRFTSSAFLRPAAGTLIVFLGLLSVVVQVDSEFGTFIVTYLRYLPLLFIIQAFLFRE